MSITSKFIIKAAENNKTKVVKRSIKLQKKLSDSFDIGQIRDKDGNTTLHYAARNSNHEMVKLLIKYGVDVNTKNRHGQTALTFAIGNFLTGKNVFNYYKRSPSLIDDPNNQFRDGDAIFTIYLLLIAGTEYNKAEFNVLLGIMKSYEDRGKYVYYCEEIKKVLYAKTPISFDKTQKNVGNNNNVYDVPENCTSENIYEEIDDSIGNGNTKHSICDESYDSGIESGEDTPDSKMSKNSTKSIANIEKL
ncbi:ankyrin repeat domain-containing protein [Wolbachia endosymbiont of Ctenocephalides felis wCfeT]|uniref:ankyrin repeat domain-containing protein n=1 Tax=Wolbachia endosymbiont of Ctenocephalides felis wCfeT TaxID=2732593 RepID=UPI0014463E6C|nr:ankyrin repeat domain-containing protein [Wolbachia endosymbiont of Ctenocephalides felis wCfeT]